MSGPPVLTEPSPPTDRPGLGRLVGTVSVLVLLAMGALWLVQPAAEPAPAVEAPPAEIPSPGFLDGAAGFALQVGEIVTPYTPFSAFVLPGDSLQLDALFTSGAAEAVATGGTLRRSDARRWTWTAPAEPGLSRIQVTNVSGEALTLHAFTLVPFDHQSDAIGGYAIGDYEDEPKGGNPRYDEPPGFVRVTPGLVDIRVSPHFTLGQFLAKQASDWPKYEIVDPALLLKLERVLSAVRREGFDVETLTVLSGFRTPAYNAAIGNTTVYSRHLYGDAADVFVDVDGDGVMDDLNRDGAVTREDAVWLADLVESLTAQPWYEPLVGGLGIYGPAPHRGPFVHVDTRGEPVRW